MLNANALMGAVGNWVLSGLGAQHHENEVALVPQGNQLLEMPGRSQSTAVPLGAILAPLMTPGVSKAQTLLASVPPEGHAVAINGICTGTITGSALGLLGGLMPRKQHFHTPLGGGVFSVNVPRSGSEIAKDILAGTLYGGVGGAAASVGIAFGAEALHLQGPLNILLVVGCLVAGGVEEKIFKALDLFSGIRGGRGAFVGLATGIAVALS